MLNRAKNRTKTALGIFCVSCIIIFILLCVQEMKGATPQNSGISYVNANSLPYYHERMIKAIGSDIFDINISVETMEQEFEHEYGESDATDADAVSPSTSAQSAILIDSTSKNIIYEQNAYKRLPMASTTKVMFI